MLIAIPMAKAAKPDRTVFGPSSPDTIPAGFGCSFDVGFQPSDDAFRIVTVFSDGRTVTIGHGRPTLTNLDTGESYVQTSRYKATETYNPESNDVLIEVSGRIYLQFFPGDQGPSGTVGANGALFAVAGHAALTVDLDTFVYTSFSLDGQSLDLCAAIG